MNRRSNRQRIVAGAISGILFLSLVIVATSIIGNRAAVARTVQANEENGFRCHNKTLNGRYATRGDGVIPSGPPPAPMIPFATVSLMTLDGAGNLTNAVTTSANGFISSNLNHGTYSLNEDCTGTMTINIPVPPFQLDFYLVVAEKGKEFNLIATTPSVVTVGGKRVD